MSKPVKNMIVKEYRNRFSGVEGAVLVEIRGLDAPATNKMRNDFARKSVKVAVVKNTLARRACAEVGNEALLEYLVGQTALVWAKGDPAAVAKAINDFAKNGERRLRHEQEYQARERGCTVPAGHRVAAAHAGA